MSTPLKICEIWSNKGIFPLFIQFPYLKKFDEILPKSPKPRTEIGFSDRSSVQKFQVLFKMGHKFTHFSKELAYFHKIFDQIREIWTLPYF